MPDYDSYLNDLLDRYAQQFDREEDDGWADEADRRYDEWLSERGWADEDY